MINRNDIFRETKYLMKISDSVKNSVEELKKVVPKGSSLRAVKHGQTRQYFIRGKGNGKNGIYIKKKDRYVAEALAQIEYDEKLLTIISDEITELQGLQRIPINNPFQSAMDKVNVLKRDLIKMPFVSDEDFIINWLSQEYERLGFRDDAPEFYTKRGLRLRSKSEVIISELLDGYEVPYLYEKPLVLSNGKIVHPDFTLLNIKTRKEIIWEHFGMMDDIEYRNNAFLKIREYESNGYYQGNNMIWTFETAKYPINIKCIDGMIKCFAG